MTETNWQTTLTAQGAVIIDGNIQHFGDAPQELTATSTGNTLCDLSHLGLLALNGDDAITFLQGQVTNDVTQLHGNNAHYSAYCSPKGRILALFLAFAHSDTLYLQLSQPLLAATMKRLKMYVMRSKVEIQDTSNDMVRLGVNGPDTTETLTAIFGQVPEQNYDLVAVENGAIIKLPGIDGHHRYEVIVKAETALDAWNAIKASCSPVGKPCWDWLDIQTGCPDVLEKTKEQFVPQMLNLDLLNGINFKKGCYTGQEIVARTHYLGKVKRRTYLASIASTDDKPVEGDKVLDADGNETGQIVKAAPNLTNGYDALVELRIEAKEAGNITWNNAPVTFGTLPYTIVSEE